jgi:hypothetical protein
MKDKKRHDVVIRAEPQDPICLPNNPAKLEPIKDKKIDNKYIL